jgi:uncharacterized protein DUF4838
MSAFELSTLGRSTIYTPPGAAPPTRFAAQELQRYLQQLTDIRVPLASAQLAGEGQLLVLGPTPRPAMLSIASEPDSFAVLPDADRITCGARSEAALLHSVYALLARCGCEWSLHPAMPEHVPRLRQSTIELEPLRQVPRFAVRGYCADIMTWHYTQPEYFRPRLDDDRAFIDWMAKSAANRFLFIRHPFDTQLSVPELLPEFERRGINVEYGGHVLPLLLPRELFADHPDYFPAAPHGERTDYGNLCTSSDAALATASANAVEWIRQHAESAAVHIWGADVWKGGWCHCTACRDTSVQDQSLRICNAVSAALANAGLERPVCYLAYHDTIDPQMQLVPHANVFVEFAPRERCYGHPLDDPTCATNQRYVTALARYTELFEGRARVFEYYGDAILFCGCAVPLTEVIERDLDCYSRLGAREITMLQFGTFSLSAYPTNFMAFASATRSGGGCAAAVAAYHRQLGAHAAQLGRWGQQLEQIMQTVVTYADILRPPRAPERARAVLADLRSAVPRLAALGAEMEEIRNDAIAAQATLVAYTKLVLQGVAQRIERSLEGGSAATSTEAQSRAIYDEALQLIAAMDRRFQGLWGAVDLPIVHQLHASGQFAAMDAH